jgi:hypothetical protein
MRMRVSGERSSCEALASRDFCEASSCVLGGHQRLDAFGSGIEARRQVGDLVLAL